MNLFDAEARTLYEREFQAGRRDSFSVLFDSVPGGSDVLDVGIGGGALGRRLAVERGCRVDGVTISAEEAQHSRDIYRSIEVADLNLVGLDSLFPGRRYDTIICADVLEHLTRPTAVLDACRGLLAEGGRLLVSIPNVGYSGLIAELLAGEFRYREEGLLDRTHIRFFTRRSLLRMMTERGWEVDAVEPVILDLHHSEFRPALDLLSPSVRRSLLSLPDALTYQFVVRAHPSSAGPARPDAPWDQTEATPLPAYPMRLCLGQTTGFADERTVVAAARIGEQRQRVRFPLPADVGSLTGLRLEPADRPGFLHLYSMRLLDARGAALWTWDGDVDSLQTGATRQVVFRTPWTAGQGVVLLLTGEYPCFELPAAATTVAASVTGTALEIELSWPMSAEYLLFADELNERDRRAESLQCELAQARVAQREAADLAARRAAEVEDGRRQLHLERAARASELRRASEEIASLAYALDHGRRRSEKVAQRLARLREHVTALESSRWTRLGARLARWLGRTGSPLVRGAASLLTDEPARALRPPRAAISIVIPVYKGLPETRTCLESVLGNPSLTPLHIVIVNDASPEPEITAYLREVAARDSRVELIENTANLGFVASANLGMLRHGDDDVILLNSDTEVAGDWIDRLREAAYRERSIATVTPFSNAATICSYPKFCVDGPMPADVSASALDRYFAAENACQMIEVPTAVGFCMFIRRDCLDELGAFDATRFGRGYGEENDFCMRARAAGWRHALALDTFVRHAGGISFGKEKADRVRQAQELLATLHPDYGPAVARHIEQDPARAARLRVDLARLRARGLVSVLFVSDRGSAATQRRIRERAAVLQAQANVFLLQPVGAGETVLEWLRHGEGLRLGFRLPDEYYALVDALRALGVAHIDFHNTLGPSARVAELPQSLALTYDFTVHDYLAVCPQQTFSDEIGRYCGELGREQCRGCLERRPAPGGISVDDWRGGFRLLLEGARYVIAPSEDAAARLRRYFPAVHAVLAARLDDPGARLGPPHPEPLGGDRSLRIVVLGPLDRIGGTDVIEATAALAAERGSRLEFHLVGAMPADLRAANEARLIVHGEQAKGELPVLLDAIRGDLAWFPVLWPDTHGGALDAALAARLPVVAPDLGAFPERLSGRPWTWICPWYWLAGEWLQFFENLLVHNFDRANAPECAPGRPVTLERLAYARDYLGGLQPRPVAAALPEGFVDRAISRESATGSGS